MIQFHPLQKTHLEMVLGWRTQPQVTAHMLTDVTGNMDDQVRWFDRISKDPSYAYWVIHYNQIPIGLFNLAAIDRVNQRCNAGYYIGNLEYRQLGALIPPFMYNYVFRELKLRKIYGEVVSGNQNILKIHELHGYRQVGVMKDHFFKGGKFHDVIAVELLADTWLEKRKYQNDIAEFVNT